MLQAVQHTAVSIPGMLPPQQELHGTTHMIQVASALLAPQGCCVLAHIVTSLGFGYNFAAVCPQHLSDCRM